MVVLFPADGKTTGLICARKTVLFKRAVLAAVLNSMIHNPHGHVLSSCFDQFSHGDNALLRLLARVRNFSIATKLTNRDPKGVLIMASLAPYYKPEVRKHPAGQINFCK